jgi:cellulose biosynthesis protein BcsQ
MATLEGKKPEQITAEIVKAAVENIVVEIDGVRGQELDELIRYKNARLIYSKGERYFQTHKEEMRKEFLESVIEAQFRQRKKLDEAVEKKEKLEYFQLLVSRGVGKVQALEMAGM